MKRKIFTFLIISLIVICGIVGTIYYQGFSRKIIENTLSSRAKEYLKDKDHSQSLREFNVGDNQKTSAPSVYGKKDHMNTCYNFTIPFTIDNHHQDGVCNEYYSLANPKGSIYANEVVSSVGSLDELSDVVMRRASSETYEESRLNAGGREYLVFKNKQEGFQKTAFYLSGNKLFTLTFSSDNIPDSEIKFKAILASVELL